MKSIEDIMAMAQNVQNELTKAQANLDTIEVEGASGGGLVKVTASAKGRIIAIAIDDSRVVGATPVEAYRGDIEAAVRDIGER